MIKTIFDGNGMYGWVIRQIVPQGLPLNTPTAWYNVVAYIKDLNLSYLAIKVADGQGLYNLRNTGSYWVDDILPGLFDMFTEHGLRKIGWQYLYGTNPQAEAAIAIKRIRQFGLQGYILDPEGEYKNRPTQARIFMQELKNACPDIPLALSTYRYPTVHPEFPWKEFLYYMNPNKDVHMPQVYWMGNYKDDGSTLALERSYGELIALKELPFCPAGALWGEYVSGRYWRPSVPQLLNFNAKARSLACNGLSWWVLDRLVSQNGYPTADSFGWTNAIKSISSGWNAINNIPTTPVELTDKQKLDILWEYYQKVKP